jgi:hypothetical protein
LRRFSALSRVPPFSWLVRVMRHGSQGDETGPGQFLWRSVLPLVLILVAAAALRFYGLNWDDGHWLHPDERKIYFVVMDLAWPRSLGEALSPDSPLNPGFFAYGSLPIYLLKLVASLLAPLWPTLRYLDNLHLVGRPLAALFDLGIVYLTYRLARILWRPPLFPSSASFLNPPLEGTATGLARRGGGEWGALLVAALVGVAILHIQHARFYTVDVPLTFFVLLTLNLGADVAGGGSKGRQVAFGIALGLALATKVSAAPLALLAPVAYDIRFSAGSNRSRSQDSNPESRVSRLLPPMWPTAWTLGLGIAVFFLTQPYVLIDWPTFLDHTVQESEIARGILDVPYTVQYAGTLPFLYSIWQTALWGLGLPLGLLGWAGLAASFVRWLRWGSRADALLLAWAGPYFVVTGLLYTRYLRYMLPLTPILCILAVRLLVEMEATIEKRTSALHRPTVAPVFVLLYGALLIATGVYALLFVRIFAQPHSWVVASEWIFEQIPAGDTLAVEHWDAALPLPVVLGGEPQRVGQYMSRTLPLYSEPDDTAKWEGVAADLTASDYVIVASRRLYGSIPREPNRYPVASRYHELLLGGQLGFELEQEFTRGPAWLNPRLPPLPDPAPAWLQPDESFVIYDHPRALVLRNVERLGVDALLNRLGVGE